MKFSLSADEETFRTELVQFLTAERDKATASADDPSIATLSALADSGWLTVAWPPEYGGRGASPMQQLILKEEAARFDLNIDYGGPTLIGPVLMRFGSDSQKAEHLSPIAKGERRWAQAFSEPNAGSDLASLQTRADREGDDYRVNGSKIWSSYASTSDWVHLLVRTDQQAPKHKGISYLLVDLRSPGITVQNLAQMNGDSEFCEIFLEDVRVPVKNRIGEENRGWYYATSTLNFERSGVERNIAVRIDFERGLNDAVTAGSLLNQRLERPSDRQSLAQVAIDIEVGALLARRVASLQQTGEDISAPSAMSKVFNSELQQHIADAFMGPLGLDGQILKSDPRAPSEGHWSYRYLDSKRRTIGGGTSEIQRNLIATRGLGLPRG